MRNIVSLRRLSAGAWGALAVVLALFCDSALAANTIVSGLSAGVGIAADPAGNAAYFVEWNGGRLKRIRLTPGCDTAVPATCAIATVATGFSHPQDVALDLENNTAYVTTRDDAGTTGAIWRVDTKFGTKTLITSNLGAPQQIALDVAAGTAWTVGYDSGELWKVQLSTGAKSQVMSGLGRPVGLLVSADRTRAYVTEQLPPRLVSIDLGTGARIGTIAAGLTSPFFLRWSDASQTAFFLVQRDPANNVLRVDVPTSTTSMAITGLPVRPSGIAVNSFGKAFVATDGSIVMHDLSGLAMGEPVFLAVGNVPSTSIVDGYATTTPGYFLRLKDAPFGSTLNIFGNLNNFKTLGATHYRVLVSYNGGAAAPVTASWGAARWNASTSKYETALVAPTGSDGKYAIPSEYPAAPQRWVPPFLMVRWPSGPNGVYAFSVQILKATTSTTIPPTVTWTNLTSSLPAAKNKLVLRVDNDAPVVRLEAIYQHGSTTPVKPCTIVSSGPASFDLEITAHDPNGHILSYGARALWGNNASATVIPTETYATHVNADGPHLWKGVTNLKGPAAGWTPSCNCAHTFIVDVWKRTTNGYSHYVHSHAHQSITINNTGNDCK